MITVHSENNLYRLRSDGEVCGARLVKAEPFPLRRGRPFDYDTEAEALQAATKLEKYLLEHDAERIKRARYKTKPEPET